MKKTYNITVLPGDGIGPEVTAAAVRALDRAGEAFGFKAVYDYRLIGGAALDAAGVPLTEETVEACKASDAVLMGAVGGPKWDGLPGGLRPEAGLLGIRKSLGLFANLRPARIFPQLRDASPLRPDKVSDGLDLLVVRELTGGIYFGRRGRTEHDGFPAAFDTEIYNTAEIDRILETGFELARGRKKKLCSVDKANILESSRLWRERALLTAEKYPDVTLTHLYVDNCAMQLVMDPAQFDVIVTSNMFGDILSDEASMVTGSIGMLPSASLGGGRFGLYEPVHGSAPDIAGQDRADPLATILSAAVMLRLSLDEPDAADAIERAVGEALTLCRTADIGAPGYPTVGCEEMAAQVAGLIGK